MSGESLIYAVAAPAFLILIGAGTKALLARKWSRRHFFLGVELTVAAIATVLDHFLDLARKPELPPASSVKDAVGSGLFLLVAILLLIYVLTIHQAWEEEQDRLKHQFWYLVIVANALGTGLLVVFALWVKR
jgi:hypothetical protein